MKTLFPFFFAFLFGSILNAQAIQFEITYPENLSEESLTGRLRLYLSPSAEPAPRFQVRDDSKSAQVFGINVENWKAGEKVTIDESVFGYPIESSADLPSGIFYAQLLFDRYEEFNLADGRNLTLPSSWEAGRRPNNEPGNLFSQPQSILIGDISDDKPQLFKLKLDETIPEITPPEDSKYVKHIEIKSEMLSEFWGRDMYLGAHVLLPHGFDEHPEAKYPLMVFHGHFPSDFGGWRTTPPDPNLKPDFSERFNVRGYNRVVQEEQYDFYKKWVSDTFPRFIIIEIQHANPYYDDSYAVNSANLGPYGDAITFELIPYIEDKFRGIGEGWSRFLYGGSTGGWEAIAAQVFYPDEYNGCFAACPDPIDFRAYCLVDIYEDENAYYMDGPFRKQLRAGRRDFLGNVSSSLKDMNYKELALGDKSRSSDQWDIWQAVYSPVGEDGYPAPIWDKKTGVIDKKVAEYWRENYDLQYILRRDWNVIGEKLKGKIHLYCGDMDNYYLNNAVYLMEEFLEGTMYPYYEGEVKYGDRAEHCWNGDPVLPNHITRLRYNTMYVPKILKRMEEAAPEGADLKSWRY